MKYWQVNKLFDLYALDAAAGTLTEERKRKWEEMLTAAVLESVVPTSSPHQPSHRFRFESIPRGHAHGRNALFGTLIEWVV
jgi:hypothetical protein